ncbi:hypothetical protein HHI36_014995 [Cryptolaemus montrouzieri]|uniref:USP8 dimerisation domain-containing protein n=1 Tax=Cryptolaemus montrouzieri TaxID=559131 RepID=A0ABD2N4A5_9CUCU
MADWSITALNTADLNPKRRIDVLYDRARTTHVDSNVEVKRYYDISSQLLNSARKLFAKGQHEASLLSFLRYQTLVKNLKTHTRYKDLPIGKRAAFDYKLKEVAKNVKKLNEIVFGEYKRFFNLTDQNITSQDLEG